ncbi:MAG: hypothetical protein ACOYIQ_01975 [Christensenellales bacterium]|jgi:hypothetical protein
MSGLNIKVSETEKAKDVKLTGYDLFMQEKYGNYLEKTGLVDESAARAKKAAKSIREKIKKMSFNVEKDSYKEELLKKLKGNADAPASGVYEQGKSEEAGKSGADSAKKLTKAGKIFVSLYVIITLALASTLLWVNMDGQPAIDANADSGYMQNESISPLAQSEEKESRNWFDRFCDSLNKP